MKSREHFRPEGPQLGWAAARCGKRRDTKIWQLEQGKAPSTPSKAAGPAPTGHTATGQGALPEPAEGSGKGKAGVGEGGLWDLRASLHETTHLTGQGTPGGRGGPSSPTVAHCSPCGEAWQPRGSRTGGLFSSSVGHAFPGHTFPPSKGFVQAPGSDHKKCPFLWRAHLRREVLESQTAC